MRSAPKKTTTTLKECGQFSIALHSKSISTIRGERRVSASGCVLKLPKDLPSELSAQPSILRFSAAARLELNVQNAKSLARATQRTWNVSNNPTLHPRRHLSCKRSLCTCQQQVHGGAILTWRARVLYHVHWRDKLIQLGNVSRTPI